MNNKNLTQLKNDVFNKIKIHLKKHTLLTSLEVKKIFNHRQLYGTTLYWLSLAQNQKSCLRLSYLEITDLLSIMEILIKASLTHSLIDNEVDNISSTSGSGEKNSSTKNHTQLEKNTYKILLGDMLITASINVINSLKDKAIKKSFHSLSKKIFLQKIKLEISKYSKQSSPIQNTNQQSWILILPFFLEKSQIPNWRTFFKKIIFLLNCSLHFKELETIKKKLLSTQEYAIRHNLLTPQNSKNVFLWLKQEISKPDVLLTYLHSCAKDNYQVQNYPIYQLLL